MAKWAIVQKDTGMLSDFVDEADKFEIYEGADATDKWMEVPDDATFEHKMVNGVVIHHTEQEDLRDEAVVDRRNAYGGIDEQLDMQYKDLLNGTTTWKDHIANVKATTTKPSTIAAFVPDPKKTQLIGRASWDPWVDNWTPP